MKSFSSFLSLVLATLTILSALPAMAQVIVSPNVLVTVGVGPITGTQANAVTQLLSSDLTRTGMISPIPNGSGDYLASGTSAEGSLTGKLVNAKTGSVVFSETYTGTSRAVVHQFADAITKAVTGLPGFASSKLTFIGGSGSTKELYLADIDGANARAVTHDGTISAGPAFSRNGEKIAYTSYKSGYPDVYVIDVASGSRTRVAFFPGINSGPSFSPDGSQIALTLSKDGNPEIYTMPVSGGTPNRITRTRGSETSPSWSPAGDQLVYSSDDHGSPQLYIGSSQGVSEMDHLVTGNSFCTKPDWSPDGKLIAFTTRIGGVFQIGVFDMASRTGRLVTTSGGQDPSWTRDSRHLIYSNGGHLYLLDTVSRQSLPVDMSVSASEPGVSR